jgi:hypothetical protein
LLDPEARFVPILLQGLDAAHEAGLPLNLNIIVVKQNAHEVDQMITLAASLSASHTVYSNISPHHLRRTGVAARPVSRTPAEAEAIYGLQRGSHLLHADPHGMASICKVGRDPQTSLLDEGLDGLARLGGIVDRLLLRQGAALAAGSLVPAASACR